jgi:hypothetical protein
MVNWLSHGFDTQKRQSIIALLSASDDVFITTRSMAGHEETISKLMVESLRAESDSLRENGREYLAKARTQDGDEHRMLSWSLTSKLYEAHPPSMTGSIIIAPDCDAFVVV